MSDLDNKLRKLLAPLYVPEDFDDAQLIAQIKQAFNDAGYRHNLAAGFWSKELEREGLMTGQQWYDKLMKEFLKVNHIYETPEQDDWVAKFTDFVEAAKKAANL